MLIQWRKKSIIKILDRLDPKKIIILSSAPQIRYPDCYGIDMAKMGDFIAFQAAISLLKETNQEDIILNIYDKCKSQEKLPKEKMENFGQYEDAVKKNSPFLFHSILSPYINLGLITPKEVITKVLTANKLVGSVLITQ